MSRKRGDEEHRKTKSFKRWVASFGSWLGSPAISVVMSAGPLFDEGRRLQKAQFFWQESLLYIVP